MMTRWFFMLLCLPFMAQGMTSKVEFFRGNLSAAKTMAASEGKLYFAEFSASWCAPCRMLEETTFSDPQVINYIAQHYIPVKIDIDDFDGMAMKQVYNVQTIPTIIVFNSKGQLLEKYDKALPSSKMIALLKKHNTPANRIKTVSASTTTASSTTTTSYTQPTSNTYTTNRPVIRESHSPMKPSTTPSRPDKNPVTPAKVEATPAPPKPILKPMPQGDGLYRFEVRKQASKGFSVQIGAFKEYGNVLREVARVQDDFDQPILVHIVRKGEQSIYKIMIGDFASRPQAINYQAQMKSKGVPGVIKDLSTLK